MSLMLLYCNPHQEPTFSSVVRRAVTVSSSTIHCLSLHIVYTHTHTLFLRHLLNKQMKCKFIHKCIHTYSLTTPATAVIKVPRPTSHLHLAPWRTVDPELPSCLTGNTSQRLAGWSATRERTVARTRLISMTLSAFVENYVLHAMCLFWITWCCCKIVQAGRILTKPQRNVWIHFLVDVSWNVAISSISFLSKVMSMVSISTAGILHPQGIL